VLYHSIDVILVHKVGTVLQCAGNESVLGRHESLPELKMVHLKLLNIFKAVDYQREKLTVELWLVLLLI